MHTKQQKLQAIERLLDIMDDLRVGCPWDKKQTYDTLRHLTIEEVYELADAIIEKDEEEIKKELGDLLLHIVFYAKIGSENGTYDIADVANAISDKLVYRHPHIYADLKVKDEQEVKENWEKLKLKEGRKSVLEGVPKSLPAMVKAMRLQEKAKGVGFDWDHKEQVWDKVQEELSEFKAETDKNDFDKMEDEFGDVLFSLINYARFVGINPETALERTNKKFIKRFQFLEQKTKSQGYNLAEMSLSEMEKIWQEAKKHTD
jgi:XTP/dITP diphosphohydrolase